MNILLIEDEDKIADFVMTGLNLAGMQAEHLTDGSAGLQRALSNPFDAIVIDLMLPSLDGISIIKHLRKSGLTTPLILLTAKTDLQDRLQGFEAGADDYLPKPFFIEELVARIKILINRQSGLTISLIEENGLQLNRITREAVWSDHQATLSQREFTLIEYLIRSPDHIFSRNQILKHVWGLDFDPKTNVVDVCIQRVRKKLIHPSKGDPKKFPIESIRGIGYRFSKT
jgi:DNA-binding response OmpR family regulator